MATKFPSPTDDAADELPTIDRSGRYPKDRFLRSKGWQIHARPKNGPALWFHPATQQILPFEQALAEETGS